jgi:hypothetical protein
MGTAAVQRVVGFIDWLGRANSVAGVAHCVRPTKNASSWIPACCCSVTPGRLRILLLNS